MTAADLGAIDTDHLHDVRRAAEERGLFLEYNFSLDASEYDDRLTHTMEEGIAIAETIGSDIGKISMDVKRPHPVCGSAFHPKVIPQLERIARQAEAAAPVAQNAGVRSSAWRITPKLSAMKCSGLSIASTIRMLGACVDTNNSLMVGEDPLTAIRKLAPVSFTNHFSDHRIVFDQYGCRITGVATGTGDVPMRQAYQVIRTNSNMKRLNIEVEFDHRSRRSRGSPSPRISGRCRQHPFHPRRVGCRFGFLKS